HPGAGADVAAAGGRGPAGGVRGVGRGQVVAAAGGSAAAGPGGGGGRRAGGGGLAAGGVYPDPGAAGRARVGGGAAGGGAGGGAGTGRRGGGGWRPIRTGSRSPPARLPWRGHWHRQEVPTAPWPSVTSRRRSAGCCWWWTSSRSCSPSALTRGSGGRSSA